MIYLLMILLGAAAIAVCMPLMLRESRQRRLEAIKNIHTDFVAVNCKLEPVHIAATQMTIGRRTRRCDICLIEAIRDRVGENGASMVSQLHARLWWDGSNFRIAPVYSLHLGRRPSEPKIWVNMVPVTGEEGKIVQYGDIIAISDEMYKFKLVDTSGQYPELERRAPRAKRAWKIPRLNFRQTPPHETGAPRRKHRRKWSTVLMVLVLLVVLAVNGMARMMVMPRAEQGLGERKEDTATFLLCGVDREGVRTDTMMLVYISGSENKIGLLSIPRDTITHTAKGNTVKLNAIYRGRGTEGAEELMQYVEQYIGYRPDGYLVFNWALVEDITNLMGGLDITLERDVKVSNAGEEIHIPAGEAHLDGKQVLATVRFRGYATADLGRTEVQRKVIKACVEQWVSMDKLGLLDDAMKMLQEQSVTDLTTENLLWIAKTVLNSRGEMVTGMLEGYAEYRNHVSYYILNPRSIVEQINADYNPYLTEVTQEDLNVVR